MRLTLRHRFAFSSPPSAPFGTPDAWDELRDREEGFALAADRTTWELAAQAAGLEPRAQAIAAVLSELGARRVCSYGVGAGFLEWNLRRIAPELELTCTDFAPRAATRLAEHLEVPVVVHDLRVDPPLAADVHLFHRIDTEMSDDEWSEIFVRYREPVLLALSELVDARVLARELVTRLRYPSAPVVGWIRNESAIKALWSETHDDRRVELADLPGYVLTPIAAQTASTSSSRISG